MNFPISFIWPEMLLFLLLIPLFVLLYLNLQRRRRRIMVSFGDLGILHGDLGNRLGKRRHITPALFLVGFTILLIALARPQTVVSLPRVEGTLMLAFDVSGSMAANDLKPNRMEAAKTAARDFVRRQPSSVQIGLVAFSDGGLSVQAPTNDQDAIINAINRLAPQRGTSLAHGILASLNAIALNAGQGTSFNSSPSQTPAALPTPESQEMYTSTVIVLLSDGENNAPPDPFDAAQTAADFGVRIYTVGIGSPAGTTLDVNGFNVHTQLDEATLQRISQLTNGVYYNAENEKELNKIYENLDPQLVIKPEEMEVTSILTGASILILLIGGVFSLMWFNRLP